jgi:hypothetical protein
MEVLFINLSLIQQNSGTLSFPPKRVSPDPAIAADPTFAS